MEFFLCYNGKTGIYFRRKYNFLFEIYDPKREKGVIRPFRPCLSVLLCYQRLSHTLAIG